MFKLALIQMLVEGGRREANLFRAEERVVEAAVNGAKIVVLPEALPLGWTDPSAAAEADAIPDGGTFLFLSRVARENQVYLCSGVVERGGGAVFNSAILLDPEGALLLHHRKLNELAVAHELYGQGDRLGVCRTPLATFGIMICSDAFARGQIVSRTLGLMGAEVILSPCSWAVPADRDQTKDPYGALWLDNYAPVARDFHVWIAGVSNVGVLRSGPWEGRHCIGNSLLINPDGKTALQGSYGPAAEEILYADLEPRPRPARGDGWETWWKEREMKSGRTARA